MIASASLAHADELSDLRAQVKAMKAASSAVERRLANLERQKTAKPVLLPATAPAIPLVAGATARSPVLVTSSYPGYFDVPGTNTSIKIGGFVKIDGTYDVRGGGIGGVASDFGEINLKGSAASNRAGDFQATARQTQLNFTTLTPSQFGDIKTFVNVDFYAGTNGNFYQSNSFSPRLRQAYVSAGNIFGGSLLIGQDWSTFMDLDSYPETLDLNGPVGVSFNRQPQVRYTRDIGGGNKVYFSAENAFGSFEGDNNYPVFTGGGAPSTNNINPIPDFVAKFTHEGDWGHFALSGIARYIKANTGGAVVNGFQGQSGVLGGGGLAGVVIKTVGLDTINFQAVGGPGIGRYLFGEDDFEGDSAHLTNFDANGIAHSIKTTTAYGFSASYQHYWAANLRSNFVGGYAHYNNEFPDDPTDSTKQLVSAFADIIYSPLPNVSLGLEFLYGLKQVDQSPLNQASYGTASRVLASAKVGF